MTYTNCCLCRVDPPDDEQQVRSKHAEAYYWNKLIENSAYCWFILYGYNTYYLASPKKNYTGIQETSCKNNYTSSRNECRIHHASEVTRIVINDEWKYIENSDVVVMNNVKILHFQVHSQNYKRRLVDSSCLSLCLSAFPSAWNNTVYTLRIFMKFDIWGFSENLSRKFKFL